MQSLLKLHSQKLFQPSPEEQCVWHAPELIPFLSISTVMKRLFLVKQVLKLTLMLPQKP